MDYIITGVWNGLDSEARAAVFTDYIQDAYASTNKFSKLITENIKAHSPLLSGRCIKLKPFKTQIGVDGNTTLYYTLEYSVKRLRKMEVAGITSVLLNFNTNKLFIQVLDHESLIGSLDVNIVKIDNKGEGISFDALDHITQYYMGYKDKRKGVSNYLAMVNSVLIESGKLNKHAKLLRYWRDQFEIKLKL